MNRTFLFTTFLILLSFSALAFSEDYNPQPEGDYLFFENFQHGLGRWVVSADPDYTGTWQVASGVEGTAVANSNDKGLVVGDVARKHAISTPVSIPSTEDDFIVQFEVRTQKYLECGGAYLKLIRNGDGNGDAFDPESLNGRTPYAIMFGPDKCGGDVMLHFIFQRQNPISLQWEEKALRPFPSFPTDTFTHVYTLHLKTKDNAYEIRVDDDILAEGSLYEDFEPPVNPPQLIDDPTDFKPADWVDDEMIPDPTVQKPDDWDETAPLWIPDPYDSKPDTWVDEEYIFDPEAVQPPEWDLELDGDWEAPTIRNPACLEFGCGQWEPRKIPNPEYKGPWSPPMIPNPEYIGEWQARQIPNPYYFQDQTPARFPEIVGLGFELWTMTDLIMFDNILITRDPAVAESYREVSLSKIAIEEELQRIKEGGSADIFEQLAIALDELYYFVSENPLILMVTIATVVLVTLVIIVCCCQNYSDEQPRPARPSSSSSSSSNTPPKSSESSGSKSTEREKSKSE